jgi:hypothetical protein
VDNSSPKFLTTFVIKKVPKENKRPKGENSTNLVTLMGMTSLSNRLFSLSETTKLSKHFQTRFKIVTSCF